MRDHNTPNEGNLLLQFVFEWSTCIFFIVVLPIYPSIWAPCMPLFCVFSAMSDWCVHDAFCRNVLIDGGAAKFKTKCNTRFNLHLFQCTDHSRDAMSSEQMCGPQFVNAFHEPRFVCCVNE